MKEASTMMGPRVKNFVPPRPLNSSPADLKPLAWNIEFPWTFLTGRLTPKEWMMLTTLFAHYYDALIVVLGMHFFKVLRSILFNEATLGGRGAVYHPPRSSGTNSDNSSSFRYSQLVMFSERRASGHEWLVDLVKARYWDPVYLFVIHILPGLKSNPNIMTSSGRYWGNDPENSLREWLLVNLMKNGCQNNKLLKAVLHQSHHVPSSSTAPSWRGYSAQILSRALEEAVGHEGGTIVQYLVEEMCARDDNKQAVFIRALKLGRHEHVGTLLKQKHSLWSAVDPIGGPKGLHPLTTAAVSGRLKTVVTLLNSGADPNSRTRDPGGLPNRHTFAGRLPPSFLTPLQNAASASHSEVVQVLVAAGADVVLDDAIPVEQPLYLAASVGCAKAVEILLQSGGDAYYYTPDHGAASPQPHPPSPSPIKVACESGYEATVRILLKYKSCEVNPARDERGTSLLIWGLQRGFSCQTLKLLLEAGAGVNARWKY